MSAFNILEAKLACPFCGQAGEFEIQFKYGDTWQHRYHLGDLLKWGGNDVGIADAKQVRIEGIGGPCPNCKTNFVEFDLFLGNDRIDQVTAVRTRQINAAPEGFEVLE